MRNHTKIKIPKKSQHLIREIYQDSDGYWVLLTKGYQFEGCHTIHEDEQKEILSKIKQIEPCDCNECKVL